jgi:hypothetical protein
MARDEALAAPQVGDVFLNRGDAPAVVGDPLLINREALFEIARVLKRVLNRLKALGKKIDAATNPSESDHKSDKQNGGI